MSSKQTSNSNKIKVPMLSSASDMQNSLQSLLTKFGHVQWVSSTESTNADLYNHARNNSLPTTKPWLLGAHLQNKGRGRSGRTWQNTSGAHLMFSCAFDVFLEPRLLPAISIICGIATCQALRNLITPSQRHNLCLKWPNDIMWHQYKLAGILVEVTKASSSRSASDHHTAIIGIGINLNDARSLSSSLKRKIADWSQIIDANASIKGVNTINIAYAIANAWYKELNRTTRQGLNNLSLEFAKVDAMHGKHVNIIDNGCLINSGIASGINDLGQLIITNSTGKHVVNVGEVSVRPNKEPSMP